MKRTLIRMSLALGLMVGAAGFMPQRAQAQAACNSTGETVGPGAEFGGSTYAIGDLDVVDGGADPTDITDADWLLTPTANVDVYAAVTIPAGTVVRLKAGAVLNVYGNFTNNGYLFVEPGATINFYGTTWTNAPTAVVGDGAATTNTTPGGAINFIAARPAIPASVSATPCVMSNYSGGNFAQNIDGGNIPMDIALHIQNANNINLINSNTQIEGTVVFDVVDGDVNMGNNNFVFTTNGTWTTNVAPNAAYFLTNGTTACAGAVEKLGLAAGASFVFPIGRAETYSGGRDFTPAIIRNDGAAADNFQVRVKNYADAISIGGIEIHVPQEGMDRAWQITSTNGSGVTMNLQHNDATNGTTYTNVFGGNANAFVTQYQGGGLWNVGPIGTNITGSVGGSAIHTRGFSLTSTATNCADAKSWYTKTPDAITPLPVKLASFTGIAQECNAVLSWETAQETSFSHFEVAYSSNASTFTKVGRVDSKRVASGSKYTFTYAQPAGKAYYQLSLVDDNGTETKSAIVQVTTNCGNTRTITLWPNPTTNKVQVNGLEAGEQVQVYGVNGQLIINRTATATAEVLDLGSYAAGMYQVIILNGTERVQAMKVIKK